MLDTRDGFFIYLYILLLLLLISVPYSNGTSYAVVTSPFAITAPELLSLFSIILIIIHLINYKYITFPQGIMIDSFTVGLIISSILISSYINNIDGFNTIFGHLIWIYVFYSIILFITILLDNPNALARSLILTAVGAATIAILQSVFGLFLDFGRPMVGRDIGWVTLPISRAAGPYGSYGSYGILLLTSLPVTMYAILNKNRQKIFQNGIILKSLGCVLVAGLIISQSRSTWTLCIIFLFVLVLTYLSRNHSRSLFIIFLLFGSVAAVLGISVIIVNIGLENVSSRLEANYVAAQLFFKDPLFGVGFGSFRNLATEYGVEIVVHNFFFETLVTAGLFGIIPLIFILLLNISRLIKILHHNGSSDPVSVAIFIGCSLALGEALFFRGIYSEEFWLVLAIMSGIYHYHFNRNPPV